MDEQHAVIVPELAQGGGSVFRAAAAVYANHNRGALVFAGRARFNLCALRRSERFTNCQPQSHFSAVR